MVKVIKHPPRKKSFKELLEEILSNNGLYLKGASLYKKGTYLPFHERPTVWFNNNNNLGLSYSYDYIDAYTPYKYAYTADTFIGTLHISKNETEVHITTYPHYESECYKLAEAIETLNVEVTLEIKEEL